MSFLSLSVTVEQSTLLALSVAILFSFTAYCILNFCAASREESTCACLQACRLCAVHLKHHSHFFRVLWGSAQLASALSLVCNSHRPFIICRCSYWLCCSVAFCITLSFSCKFLLWSISCPLPTPPAFFFLSVPNRSKLLLCLSSVTVLSGCKL